MANDANCFALSEAMDGAGGGAEVVFAALREAGLDDAHIVSAFSTLSSYAVGACQQEIGVTTRAGQTRAPLPGITALSGAEFANVVGLAGRLATRDFDEEFSAGLDLLITGLRGWVEGT